MRGKAPQKNIEYQQIDERVRSTHQAEAQELPECAAPCIESMNSSSRCLSFFRLYQGQRQRLPLVLAARGQLCRKYNLSLMVAHCFQEICRQV